MVPRAEVFLNPISQPGFDASAIRELGTDHRNYTIRIEVAARGGRRFVTVASVGFHPLARALVPGGEFHSTANDQRRKDTVLLLLMDGFSGRLVVGAMRHSNEYQRSHDDRQKQIEQNWTAAFSREHE